MTSSKIILQLIASSYLMATMGCAASTESFENFKRFNSGVVGKSMHERPSFARSRKPLSINRLENGNDEYRYLLYSFLPPCIIVYEVDPKTEIVVRSSYIGDEKGCVIVP